MPSWTGMPAVVLNYGVIVNLAYLPVHQWTTSP